MDQPWWERCGLWTVSVLLLVLYDDDAARTGSRKDVAAGQGFVENDEVDGSRTGNADAG